jgi:hypothetical protein
MFDLRFDKNEIEYWLPTNHTARKDTKQAVSEVIDALVATGKFKVADDIVCPDSGRSCKGVRLTE